MTASHKIKKNKGKKQKQKTFYKIKKYVVGHFAESHSLWCFGVRPMAHYLCIQRPVGG